jgi:hypothetical protein
MKSLVYDLVSAIRAGMSYYRRRRWLRARRRDLTVPF